MMTMKNEPKIYRGTLFNFPTICPTISEVKNCSFMRMIFLEIYKIVVKYTINGNCAGKNTQK